MTKKHLKSREKQEIHQFKKKAGWTDEHHLETLCCMGGSKISSNILIIDVYRHDAWHILFQNKKLSEVISLFKAVKSVKEFLHSISNYYKHSAFRLLFKNMTLNEVIALLTKLQELKKAQKFYLRLSA